MIDDVYRKIWELSPKVRTEESYIELTKLTRELIGLYDLQGRLSSDPFSPTRQRSLSLPVEKINDLLTDRTCLVTGGLGCVGSTLVNELLKFDLKYLIILDKQEQVSLGSKVTYSPIDKPGSKVTYVTADIQDFQSVQDIFTKYRPDFVFHTAAQRDPGLAESKIFDTVSVNVIGTLNIVKACESSGSVKQCIFSSTGKASRYLTEEIYAGTKKMCEYILDVYSRKGNVRYGMVRFTHILDNSLMNQQLKEESEKDDFIAVHCPGKFVTAQNVKEAAFLLINSLVYSEDKVCNFLIVRNLEWPVESLEMALYYIKHSGRAIPVIFKGNPIGYTEKFFRGQMNWARPQDLNLLINVYEERFRRHNAEDDIIISHISPVNEDVLEGVLQKIANSTGDLEMKDDLIGGLYEIVKDSLKYVDKEDTVNILKWGLHEKFLEIEKAKASDYGAIIPLMFESLRGTAYYEQVENLSYEKATQ